MAPTTPEIGGWFTFETGPFAGRTVRCQIDELQKADIGRRFGYKDKRPLDPPPVVRFRLFELRNPGGPFEDEKEFEFDGESLTFGLLCHVDLFPATCPDAPTAQLHSPNSSPLPSTRPFSFAPSFKSEESLRSSPVDIWEGSSPVASTSGATHNSTSAHSISPDARSPCTELLSGQTFSMCTVVEHANHNMALFVFSDIAVKREGWFRLRYRVFDIHGKAYGAGKMPILAECTGGAFQIFSTKSFPGLPPSTELTKLLARAGIRVNIREKERRTGKRRTRDAAAGHNEDDGDDYDDGPANAPVYSRGGQSVAWPYPPSPPSGTRISAPSSSMLPPIATARWGPSEAGPGVPAGPAHGAGSVSAGVEMGPGNTYAAW